MSTKIHAHHFTKDLFKNNGVPSKIVMDGAKDKVMIKFMEACQYATVQVKQLKYNTSWANRAEGAVLDNKRPARRAM